MIWMGEERAEGVSGSDTENRQDLDNLFYRAETFKDFDVLLVLSYDRLTRGGPEHGAHLIYKFRQLGVSVVSLSDDLPEDSEYSSLFRTIEFIKGEGTAKSISFHSTRGGAASLMGERMAYTKQPPYAIDRLILSSNKEPLFRIRNHTDGTQSKLHVTDDSDEIESFGCNPKKGATRHFLKHVDQRIVLINGAPDAMAHVQMMFDMFWVKGIGVKTIASTLNGRGIPAPRGGTWGEGSVYQIVMNPIYVGIGIANRMTVAKFHTRPSKAGEAPRRVKKKPKTKTPKGRPQSEWLLSHHPKITIIDPDLYAMIYEKQLARLIRKSEKSGQVARRISKHDSKYMLLGSIFDRKSGKRMSAYTCGPKAKYRYYTLMMYRNNPHPDYKDMRKFFPADAVEKAVLKCFADVLGDLRGIEPILLRYARDRASRASRDVIGLEALKAERNAAAEKKAFALDEFGDIGQELLRKKIEPLTARIRELDVRMAAAEHAAGIGSDDPDEAVRTVMTQIGDVTAMLGEPSASSLRGALNVLTRTVADAESGEAEIELRLPEDAWRRSKALAGLCATSTSPTKSGYATQHANHLVLARFRCKIGPARRDRCLECSRSPSLPELKAA